MARTVVIGPRAVQSIIGNPDGTQTITVAGTARRARIGAIVSIAADPRFPQGLLARVTGRHVHGRQVALTVTPSALNQAYRQVIVSTGGSLDGPGIMLEDEQGHVVRSAMSRAFAPDIGLHIGGTGVRCTGFGSVVPFDVEVDLSQLHWDLSFTYPSPSIHFLVTGSPVVTVNMGLNIATECHWTLPLHIVVPIPGTPLQVKISPVLQLTTNGALGGKFTWTPRLTYGFDRGNGINDEVHVFNPGTTTFGFAGSADADLFFGPDAELSLGGRVGVSATFGPDFQVSREIGPDGACEKAAVGLKIEADANADLFISSWSFKLFSGMIGGGRTLFDGCSHPASNGGSPAPSSGGSAAPVSGGAPSSGSGGTAGTPSGPVPAGATPETTGGVAHTWTNYTNAGGTEGPSIASNQTVGIACRIQGFAVADGDTWWYRIASSPWNSAYYVSADAFYNDGATSGSLTGTPFVDPNVPSCVSAPPPPPPPTWSETVGGVAHTWTNYTNAGGTQGPSIASNQTVQITCKVQGFRVADGDTWWYRIASSPWNNSYYVSADAFYNNGQTSGSLVGTPFVDAAVANC